MPLYNWRCPRCNFEVDLLRSFDDCRKPPQDSELGTAAVCPAGGGHDWQKRILPPNVAFGEGWSPDGRGMKGRH